MSTRALADVQSAAARVAHADRSLRTGIITVNGNFEGLKEISRFGDVLVLINRPQEAVYALQLLNGAFDEYFTTVAEYNRAQFELFHALGYPAREIAYSSRPAKSSRWTRPGPTSCPRWAMGRRRPPDERRPSGTLSGPSVNGAGSRMMERSVWPLMLIAGLSLAFGQPRLRSGRARPAPRAGADSPVAGHVGGRLAVDGVARHRTLHETDRPGLPPPLGRPAVPATAQSGAGGARRRTAVKAVNLPPAAGRVRTWPICRRTFRGTQGARERDDGPARTRPCPLAAGIMHLKPHRSVGTTSVSRSTSPPPCGSPTPGR